MASTTALVNRSLARIGAPRITSIDGVDATSQLVRDTYDEIRQELIRSYPWNFARFRSRLARLQGVSPIGFAYAYEKPAATDTRGGWLSTMGVFTDDAMTRPANYEDAEGVILSDEEALVMMALHDIVDPNKMDSSFRATLTMRLSEEYAIILSNSGQLAATNAQLASLKAASAQAATDMDNPAVIIGGSSWLAGRGRVRVA